MRGVAIVGLSEAHLGGLDTTRVDEVWTLNFALSTRKNLFQGVKNRITKIFELHHPSLLYHDLYEPSGEHKEWLLNDPHEGHTIISLVPLEGVRNNELYPIDAISGVGEIQRGDEPIHYATSSFCFMLAMAVAQDFDYIEVYGFNMALNEEYSYQRPAAEHWLGVARGRNIPVWIHGNSSLMLGKIYAYEPTEMVTRQMLESLKRGHIKHMEENTGKSNMFSGKFSVSNKPEDREEANKFGLAAYQHKAIIGFIDGLLGILDGKKSYEVMRNEESTPKV